MRTIAILTLLLLSQTLFGQYSATVENPFALSGVVNPQILGDLVLCDKTSKPIVASIAIIRVESGTAQVSCKAIDSLGKFAPVRRLDSPAGKMFFALDKPGQYTVLILIVDFEKKLFTEETLEVKVGDNPLPPPPPPPPPPPDDVPADAFDNLGRRVDSAADAARLPQDKRSALSTVYRSVADRIDSRAILRASDAVAELQSNWVSVGVSGEGWMSVRKLISDDGSRRALPLYEFDDYYRAVAAGLKGGAL